MDSLFLLQARQISKHVDERAFWDLTKELIRVDPDIGKISDLNQIFLEFSTASYCLYQWMEFAQLSWRRCHFDSF